MKIKRLIKSFWRNYSLKPKLVFTRLTMCVRRGLLQLLLTCDLPNAEAQTSWSVYQRVGMEKDHGKESYGCSIPTLVGYDF